MFILKMYKIINFYLKFKIEMDRKKLNKILVRHLMSTKKVMDNSMYIILFYLICDVCLPSPKARETEKYSKALFCFSFFLFSCLSGIETMLFERSIDRVVK